jgi:hypothetical protein
VSPDGDIFATGVCTATSFVGSGANLTGVASTENIRTNTNATFLQNINVSGSTTTGSLVSSGAVSGTTGTFSGAVSGTTGTFTGDLTIPDKIVHTGDTDTAIRLGVDTVTVETAGSERVRITSAGLMGIGTNSPDNILHLESSSNPYLQLEKVGTSSKIYLGNASGEAVLEATAGAIKLKPNGASNKFILDTSGNLILGAASYQNGGFGGSSHGINIAGTQPQILLHETDTDKDGYFGLASSILRIQTADSIPVTIWTNDTKRINVHETTGDTTIETGNLVIGTSGKGIDFSATADGTGSGSTSEVLDDYEEGTWSPQIGGSTTAGSYNKTGEGYYIKVGRQVTVWLNCTGSVSGASGTTRITGLPFTAASNNASNGYTAVYSAGSVQYWSGFGSADILGALIVVGTTYIYFHTDNGSSTGANQAIQNGSHNAHVHASYFTN